eukprot:1148892-Pelagomonas_calceolata.AAC.3
MDIKQPMGLTQHLHMPAFHHNSMLGTSKHVWYAQGTQSFATKCNVTEALGQKDQTSSEPKQSEMRSQVNAKSLPVQSPLVCKSTCEPDAASLKATVKTKL